MSLLLFSTLSLNSEGPFHISPLANRVRSCLGPRALLWSTESGWKRLPGAMGRAGRYPGSLSPAYAQQGDYFVNLRTVILSCNDRLFL